MVFTGELLDSSWDLPALLALVAEISDVPGNEDCVVWREGQVVCVVRCTGETVWLQPQHRPRPLPAA
jgi:hypothetical protein